ncbi:outer membrane beta-barrel family protein [Massilia aquatica]|uniref:TonB-dependent receptor n=1 Tax=Massilia aquatica TaxID=2609000 RepID=A0ABX0M8J6_9BURK|nr:outer membrane beta-barrel family protein [Massilia aquatica]NHZ43498.1 TonB-dependent receptor [Massilia aquatica]
MKQFRLPRPRGARRARPLWLALLAASAGHGAQAQGPLAPAGVTPAAGTPSAVVQAARTAAPPKPPPEGDMPVPSVTVEGERPTNRIDRQVYDIKADVSTTNGSAADALGNVPSVAVDPDGSVSLRGNSNVQILIDGKPSAMLQGENRGAALAAMAADDIESVEVINNPGAQFGNEGGGGPIINLVTRRNKRAGGLGVANLNAGTGGRANSALSGSYNQGLFSFQGGINARHDGRDSMATVVRERIDPVSGAVRRSTQASSGAGLNDAFGINGGVGYNLGTRSKLAANLAYSKRSNDQHGRDHYVNNGATGELASDYLRTSERSGTSENSSWGVRGEHKGEADGELFKMDLRVSTSSNRNDSAYANSYLYDSDGRQRAFSRQGSGSRNRVTDWSGDYERSIDTAMLKLGYKLARNAGSVDARHVNIDALTMDQTDNAARSNRFALDETTAALYGSWQWRVDERWGVLGGLRAEYTRVDIRQLTARSEARNDYLSTIPSFFISYKASDKTTIRLSYAHRIQRPVAGDLNPFVVYRDEVNVSSGNPGLLPSETDSIELGLDTALGPVESNLRAFLRKEHDLISERRYFIGDNVLLTTRDNSGGRQSGGLEFSLSGKVGKTLSLSTSGNLGYSEQAYLNNNGAALRRSATSLNLRGRINYQVSAADQVQVVFNTQGKTLIGQGVREPNSTVNLSYRHSLTPRLNVVLNVTDMFDSNKTQSRIDSDILRESSLRRYDGRLIYLGLSYRLGGVTPGGRRPGA